MPTDPRKLRPGELCRLLNSTPLGEVLTPARLRQHRTQAGRRIGDERHVDLLRYVAWLMLRRHEVQPRTSPTQSAQVDLEEIAQGAAELGSNWQEMAGLGRKLTSKQERALAALLTEPSHEAAARKAEIGTSTLYRWLRAREFREAFEQAKRQLVHSTMARIQAASGQAVETLLHLAKHGRKESDRLRAAVALLDRGLEGLHLADVLDPQGNSSTPSETMRTDEVVKLLSGQLLQVEQSRLSTPEKARLTVSLADALLRAISLDVVDKRLEAVLNVLHSREEKT